MGKSYKKKTPTKWNNRDKSIHKKIRRTTDGICRQFESGNVENEDVFFPDHKDYDRYEESDTSYTYDDFKTNKNNRHYQRPPDKRRLDEGI